jgi:hypothetical protein
MSETEAIPILFHDGCNICLELARTLAGVIAGLAVIDLSKLPQFKHEAHERGVRQLPSLVIRDRVIPVAPHSDIDHIG